jgi:hypothetical protein
LEASFPLDPWEASFPSCEEEAFPAYDEAEASFPSCAVVVAFLAYEVMASCASCEEEGALDHPWDLLREACSFEVETLVKAVVP